MENSGAERRRRDDDLYNAQDDVWQQHPCPLHRRSEPPPEGSETRGPPSEPTQNAGYEYAVPLLSIIAMPHVLLLCPSCYQ